MNTNLNIPVRKRRSVVSLVLVAAGISMALFAVYGVYQKRSFNKYHKNYKYLAEVMLTEETDGEKKETNLLPVPVIAELKSRYNSSFKHIAASMPSGKYTLEFGGKQILVTGRFMETTAPGMLSLRMITGVWADFRKENSMFLSASTAKALFGATNPVNKLVRVNSEMEFSISGIFNDIPRKSDFHELQFIGPWNNRITTDQGIEKKIWGGKKIQIYVEITPESNFDQLSGVINNLKSKAIQNQPGMQNGKAAKVSLWLNPMSDWHSYHPIP